jgi:hypothetical protein
MMSCAERRSNCDSWSVGAPGTLVLASEERETEDGKEETLKTVDACEGTEVRDRRDEPEGRTRSNQRMAIQPRGTGNQDMTFRSKVVPTANRFAAAAPSHSSGASQLAPGVAGDQRYTGSLGIENGSPCHERASANPPSYPAPRAAWSSRARATPNG